jgi:hypothetical protein
MSIICLCFPVEDENENEEDTMKNNPNFYKGKFSNILEIKVKDYFHFKIILKHHWIMTGWHGEQWDFQNNEKTMKHSDHWIMTGWHGEQ